MTNSFVQNDSSAVKSCDVCPSFPTSIYNILSVPALIHGYIKYMLEDHAC